MKEVFVLLGIISILVVVWGFELIAIWLNRSIIKNADMNTDTYMFVVRYTGFSIFVSILMTAGLAYFAYNLFVSIGSFNSKIITAMALFIIELVELVKKLFLKIEVSANSIQFKSITKRANLSFSDINKIEITRIFGLVLVDVFVNDKKIFGFNSEKIGYRHLINRLKLEEGIEWMSVLENPFDKSTL